MVRTWAHTGLMQKMRVCTGQGHPPRCTCWDYTSNIRGSFSSWITAWNGMQYSFERRLGLQRCGASKPEVWHGAPLISSRCHPIPSFATVRTILAPGRACIRYYWSHFTYYWTCYIIQRRTTANNETRGTAYSSSDDSRTRSGPPQSGHNHCTMTFMSFESLPEYRSESCSGPLSVNSQLVGVDSRALGLSGVDAFMCSPCFSADPNRNNPISIRDQGKARWGD